MRTAFSFGVGDRDGFADRIAQLAGTPEQLARMGHAARRTIEAGRFTVDAMAETYISLMEKVVSEPFARPITGMLPPDHLRGLRSWLPPELPGSIHALLRLQRGLARRVQGLVERLGK